MTLYLEKRGCRFIPQDDLYNLSDIGNYRVCTPAETVPGRDGRNYFLEFVARPLKHKRYSKLDGSGPLARPVWQVDKYPHLFIDNEYKATKTIYDRNVYGSWCNLALSYEINGLQLPYTIDGILKAVNEISVNHYDNIKFIGEA